jgi:hypothetical protein
MLLDHPTLVLLVLLLPENEFGEVILWQTLYLCYLCRRCVLINYTSVLEGQYGFQQYTVTYKVTLAWSDISAKWHQREVGLKERERERGLPLSPHPAYTPGYAGRCTGAIQGKEGGIQVFAGLAQSSQTDRSNIRVIHDQVKRSSWMTEANKTFVTWQ